MECPACPSLLGNVNNSKEELPMDERPFPSAILASYMGILIFGTVLIESQPMKVTV